MAFNSLMDGLLVDGGANSCVSPLSFKLALAMACSGAQSEYGGVAYGTARLSQSELNAWASEYITIAKHYDGSRNDISCWNQNSELPLPIGQVRSTCQQPKEKRMCPTGILLQIPHEQLLFRQAIEKARREAALSKAKRAQP
jgi:hypothetical protein